MQVQIHQMSKVLDFWDLVVNTESEKKPHKPFLITGRGMGRNWVGRQRAAPLPFRHFWPCPAQGWHSGDKERESGNLWPPFTQGSKETGGFSPRAGLRMWNPKWMCHPHPVPPLPVGHPREQQRDCSIFVEMGLVHFPSTTQVCGRGTITSPPSNLSAKKEEAQYLNQIEMKFPGLLRAKHYFDKKTCLLKGRGHAGPTGHLQKVRAALQR